MVFSTFTYPEYISPYLTNTDKPPNKKGNWGLSVFVKYGPIYSGYVKVHVTNLLSFKWIHLVGRENYKQCSRPMRGREIDHMTCFGPITRLDFTILKVVRGPPY